MRLRRRFLNRLSERGDTVVEVLMAIAVVSLILGGAYVTANRSLQNTRDAEERSNALKMAETQVEQIKYLSSSNPNAIFGGGVPANFCLVSSVALDSSNSQCTVNSGGAPSSTPPNYSLSITRSGNTFTVRSTWQRLGEGGQNAVELKYRAYQ